MKTLTIIPDKGELDCLITKVVDGDTLDVALFVPLRIRLHGIQVAERNTDKGKLVIQKLTDRLTKQVATVTLRGREKYGRMLGSIRTYDGRDVAEWLIGLGLAVEWNGKGPRPLGLVLDEGDEAMMNNEYSDTPLPWEEFDEKHEPPQRDIEGELDALKRAVEIGYTFGIISLLVVLGLVFTFAGR